MALAQQPNEPAFAEEQRLPMSYDEFLAWADEDVHAEWANGEVIVFMPPSTKHQLVSGFLSTLLLLFARAFNLGEVLTAPIEMRAKPDGAAREPDILFLKTAHRERLTAQRLLGPADLVVEVVSSESVRRDRDDKFYEYEQAGITEYLIIDPRAGKERVDFYRLAEGGKYLAILPDREGRYHSTILPGFWFHPDWFWQEAMPDPLLTLAQIAPEALTAVLAALEKHRGQ
ncbi:MAG TPA: Uma2 family endonuclease [Thermomicrobiales bacterium]|jgi:Uma2 family endonuclease